MQVFIKGALLSLTFAAIATAAHASGLSYTCAANINADSGTNLCASINSVVTGEYNSTFSNANASIYVQFGDNGGLGTTTQVFNTVSYIDYLSALTANSSHNATDTSAVASLPGSEPALYNGGDVGMTSALDEALGFTGFGVTAAQTVCTIGTSGCYNAVITINDPTDLASETGGQGYYYGTGPQGANDYAFFSVLEHETNEVLGTASCVSTGGGSLGDNCGTSSPSAVDLFRYQSDGTRVFMSNIPGAYFSTDGGATMQSPAYNTLSDGGDYADYLNTAATDCNFVQNSGACTGGAPDILTDGRSEITILDAVGYNLNPTTTAPTPEPASLILLGSGLLGLSGLIRRRLLAA